MNQTIKIKLTENEQNIIEDAIRMALKECRIARIKLNPNIRYKSENEKVLLEIRRKIYSKQRKLSDDYIYGN